MHAVSDGIAVHARTLESDAQALTDCAERLREIEAKLEDGGVAPQWLREAVNAHQVACVVAAADLAAAAARLHRYAERARP